MTPKGRIFFLTLFILLHGLQWASAQTKPENESALKVGIPSPTAASLGKYGDIPVSLYTGLANIDIPLYQVTEGSLSLPISLNYHASGIKPDEIPGWTGMGWSLLAGGMITRVVSGLPDDFDGTYSTSSDIDFASPIVAKGYGVAGQSAKNFNPCVSGYPALAINIPCTCPGFTCPGETNYNIYQKYRDGRVDLQPDQFNFNFNGHSGKFYFGEDGQVHVVPFQNLRVKAYLAGSGITVPPDVTNNLERGPSSFAWGNNYINKWEITTENGTTYVFDKLEINTQLFGSAIIENTSKLSGTFYNPNARDPAFVSAWFLTKITSPNKDFEINLAYESKGINEQWFRSQSTAQYNSNSPNSGCSSSGTSRSTVTKFTINVNTTYTVYLKTITTARMDAGNVTVGHTRVELINSLRHDLLQTNAYKLDEIQVYQGTTLRKKYSLQYSDVPAQRLRLEKVLERSSDPNASVNTLPAPYIFEYNAQALPVYHSNQTDHWGYFNNAAVSTNPSDANGGGNPTNRYLIPAIQIASNEILQGYTGPTQIPGANRESNATAMQAGVLTKITYPTGGTSSFQYQAHQYLEPLTSTPKTIGGLRIWKLTTSDGINSMKDIVKEYQYIQLGSTATSGIYGGRYPKYHWAVTFQNADPSIYQTALVLESGIWYPILYTQGSPMSYSEVTELRLDGAANGGKTRYVYYSFKDFPDIAATQYPAWYQHNMGPVISQDYKRGILHYLETYNAASATPVKKIEYQYTEDTRNSYDIKGYWSKNEFNSSISSACAMVFSTAYSIRSRWYYLSQEISTQADGGTPIVTTTKYEYDLNSKNHNLLSKTIQIDSKGKVLSNYYKYPLDYTTTSVFTEMLNRYMLNPIVETIATRAGNVVGASKHDFSLANNDILLSSQAVQTVFIIRKV